MAFPQIDEAHGKLVEATRQITEPGHQPIPITLVSVTETVNGQLVVFDGLKWPKQEVVNRLRAAADFLETQ